MRFTIAQLLLIITVSALAMAYFCQNPNTVEIYLIEDSVLELDVDFFDNVDILPLESEPVFSNADIIEYNWIDHEILVAPDALNSLPRSFYQLFAIVVDGDPVYLGTLTTHRSSDSVRWPVIMVDELPGPNQSENTWVPIQRSYWTTKYIRAYDVRDDLKLKTALRRSGRLLNFE